MTERPHRLQVKTGGNTRSKFRARRELEHLVAAGWIIISEKERGFLFRRTVYVLERTPQ